MCTITITIADDHAPTREELVGLIQSAMANSHVEHVVGSGDAAVQAYSQKPTDVVVMDLNMPGGLNGLEATRRLVQDFPDIKILILSNHAERSLVKYAIELGALGFVQKDHAFEELPQAISDVYQGMQHIGQGLRI